MNYSNFKFIAICIFLAMTLTGCGGGGDSGSSTPNTPTNPGDMTPKSSLSGKVVYGQDISDTENKFSGAKKFVRLYKQGQSPGVEKADPAFYLSMIDECSTQYSTLWEGLTENFDTGTGSINVTRTISVEGTDVTFIAYNIDSLNSDNVADVNIEVSDIPEFEFVSFMNFDKSCDGIPDLNIDTDEDGVPDTNIDEDSDGLADYDIVNVSGGSVSNAAVSLHGLETIDGRDYQASTNADGEFTFDGVATGSYQIEIIKEFTLEGGGTQTLWHRDYVEVTESDQNLGIYPVDSGPYIDHVILNGELRSSDMFPRGGRDTLGSVYHDLATGLVINYEVYIEDPNDKVLTAKYLGWDDEDGFGYKWYDIPMTPIADNPGIYKLSIRVEVFSDHYEVQIGDNFVRKYIPEKIGLLDMGHERPDCDNLRYDLCDPSLATPSFSWSEVSGIQVDFSVNNSDTILSLDGIRDIRHSLNVSNQTYTFVPETAVPDVQGVTINGTYYENTSTKNSGFVYFPVDLGYIGDETTLTIDFDVVADEDYPLDNSWHLPLSLGINPNTIEGTTLTINVADLPRAYPSDYIGNQIWLTSQYMDDDKVYSSGEVRARIKYDVAGTAEPAECTGLKINGSTDLENRIFYVGETITLEAMATDPKGLPIEVAFRRLGNLSVEYGDSFITPYDSETGMQFVPLTEVVSYTISSEDNVDGFNIQMFCRNNDGFGGSNATSPDDSLYRYLDISE